MGGFLSSLFGFSKTAFFVLFLYVVACFILLRQFKGYFLEKSEEAKKYFYDVANRVNKLEENRNLNKENLI